MKYLEDKGTRTKHSLSIQILKTIVIKKTHFIIMHNKHVRVYTFYQIRQNQQDLIISVFLHVRE